MEEMLIVCIIQTTDFDAIVTEVLLNGHSFLFTCLKGVQELATTYL